MIVVAYNTQHSIDAVNYVVSIIIMCVVNLFIDLLSCPCDGRCNTRRFFSTVYDKYGCLDVQQGSHVLNQIRGFAGNG